ncbi:hypothetical protein Nepgr_019617 [Nepenthes gracilis]|uniref:Retrotransposon gag domain-containing protein n=1 Tax=Nepenthes gracilis TaxID=150966 RepID=A0AAD3XVI4_NEPGR|nr:hypothetical protein Nepgr_019617 [Nepenthes gracilis]
MDSATKEGIYQNQMPHWDMVLYATHKFKGEAHHRWEMREKGFNMPDREISWEMFEAAFLEKYFPANLRGQKEEEFLRLRQENRSVAEYDSKFTELSHYAPFMVEDEERKVRRFFQGLRDDIRRHISTLTLTTYGEVLAKAVIYEKELERGAMSRERTFSQASKASASEGPSKKARPSRFRRETAVGAELSHYG